MKNILFTLFLLASQALVAQPWSPSGTCDFTDGQQWNNGGAKGCACTWYSVENGDTILNCAFGDCGQNALFECVYDCNGHNGYATDMIPRQCDATATPICWFNGSGSQGELFCEGLSLPVELVSFKGEKIGSDIFLTWITISEVNSSHFILQNSIDGIEFDNVAYLPGAGSSTTELHYRATHINPDYGINYYRLIQYDFNGAFEVFNDISVDNTNREEGFVKQLNLMGQPVDNNYRGLILRYYNDGTVIKVYN